MITITQKDLLSLSEIAQNNERKRKNRNYHPELNDTLQRLLNAMEPGTYVQPHKHESPDKREVFMILSGEALVVEFDNEGNIVDFIVMNYEKGTYVVEIPACTWHTIISLKTGTVVFEVKDGPYDPIDDKNFAKWAPREGDANCEKYIQTLIDKTIGRNYN